MVRHLKDRDGTVHFDSPAGDYMLCGLNDEEARETAATVDCNQCIDVVTHCHRIRDGEIKPRFGRRHV